MTLGLFVCKYRISLTNCQHLVAAGGADNVEQVNVLVDVFTKAIQFGIDRVKKGASNMRPLVSVCGRDMLTYQLLDLTLVVPHQFGDPTCRLEKYLTAFVRKPSQLCLCCLSVLTYMLA